MNTFLKRASAAVAGGALAFSGLAFASAPATAADGLHGAPVGKASARVTAAALTPDRPVDITKINARGFLMSYSSSTQKFGVVGSAATSAISYYSMSAGVYRGSRRVGTANIYSNGAGYVTFKNGWGRGTFRIANVRITGSLNSSYDYKKFDYVDAAAGGYFKVKSAIRGKLKYGNVISVKTRGSKKSFAVGVKYYSPRGWRPYKGKKVALQYKKGKWKNKKKLRLKKNGKAKYTYYSSKRYKWRVKIPKSATVQGGNSRATIRL